MADNANLSAARSAKNDEFYTQYGDIEAEMNAYVEYNPGVFKGKTILLPCDDPEWSNFTKYFASNFERFPPALDKGGVMSPASIRETNMNFNEVVDFLSHGDRVTETVVSPSDPSLLSSLEGAIGNAYRFIRASGSTPEEAMRRVLWTLFYFVQQEHPLTQEYEDAVLEAVQAARENAAFCRGGSAANDK